MVHEDNNVLQNDLNFLRSLEKYAFSLVLSPELDKIKELDEDKLASDLTKVVDTVSEYGTGLLSLLQNVFTFFCKIILVLL